MIKLSKSVPFSMTNRSPITGYLGVIKYHSSLQRTILDSATIREPKNTYTYLTPISSFTNGFADLCKRNQKDSILTGLLNKYT